MLAVVDDSDAPIVKAVIHAKCAFPSQPELKRHGYKQQTTEKSTEHDLNSVLGIARVKQCTAKLLIENTRRLIRSADAEIKGRLHNGHST